MSFQLPSNSLSKVDLEASNKSPVYVAVAVGFVLATGSVILRCVARRNSKTSLSWNDYTIFFALILFYALDLSSLLSAAKYGLGQHLPAVLTTVIPFQKVAIANITLWLATAAAIKASLLCLYYRVFSPSKRFRSAIYIGATVVFCQWLSLTLATIFQCRPVAAFWNRGIQGAKCIDLPRFTIVSGVLNLLTDVLILCLPIPMVWGLNTNRAQKVTLTGIFLLGIFVCVISIVRISKLAAVNYDDPTWRLVDVYVWTILEDSVGITSACLPTLRPLFGRFLPGMSRNESFNKKESRSSSQPTAKAQFNRLFDESDAEATSYGVPKGTEDTWISPDVAASNELSRIDTGLTRPPHSASSRIQSEHQHLPASGTRKYNYGLP